MILDQGVEGFWLDMNEPARMRPDWVGWNEEGKAWGDIEAVSYAHLDVYKRQLRILLAEMSMRAKERRL